MAAVCQMQHRPGMKCRLARSMVSDRFRVQKSSYRGFIGVALGKIACEIYWLAWSDLESLVAALDPSHDNVVDSTGGVDTGLAGHNGEVSKSD